jgi:hypothetical protein
METQIQNDLPASHCYIMKVHVANEYRESLIVQLSWFLYVGFQMNECPYCKTHSLAGEWHHCLGRTGI